MKYKVYEEKNSDGVVTNYGIAFKFLFWWIPCGVCGYFKREDAEKECKAMNGTTQILEEINMMLTAEQIQKVLNDLPHVNDVAGDVYRVMVREYPNITPHDGSKPCKFQNARFFEFHKIGKHWVLATIPQF